MSHEIRTPMNAMIRAVRPPQREQIGRAGVQDLPPDVERLVKRPARPRCEGGDMQQIAFRAVAQDEMRIGRQRASDQRHRVGTAFEPMLDGSVELRCGFSAVGRNE
ncbi:MAG: hypothetical protein WA633_22695 [Stellaceae bacterium]